jgi:hypothetical protein
VDGMRTGRQGPRDTVTVAADHSTAPLLIEEGGRSGRLSGSETVRVTCNVAGPGGGIVGP